MLFSIKNIIPTKYIYILILSLILILPAKADSIATQEFTIDSDKTLEVTTSGTLHSNIAGFTGVMDTALNINFNMITNEAISNINFKAEITDMNSNTHSAFYCTDTSQATSQSMYLVFSEENSNEVTTAGIADCKNTSSAIANNPCLIAYSGVVSINNAGTVQYVDNTGEGYFNVNVPAGTTNLNMTLSTSPKVGTYDAYSANDPSGNYVVTIYLDNIP